MQERVDRGGRASDQEDVRDVAPDDVAENQPRRILERGLHLQLVAREASREGGDDAGRPERWWCG